MFQRNLLPAGSLSYAINKLDPGHFPFVPYSQKNYLVEEINDDIILHPKTDHEFTLIWLHGLGGSAHKDKRVFSD